MTELQDVDKIARVLRKASDAYYNSDKTLMADAEFDRLKQKLIELDPDNPFLKEVGAPPSGAAHLAKVKHQIPMGSLSNCTRDGDKANPSFQEWHAGRNNAEVVLMHKLDGSSIELIYKEGKLTQAITRGDGVIGEDVTQNAQKFKGVPEETYNKLFTGSIRGEALLLLEDFKKYFTDTANPRNGANGTVRRSDGSKAEHISFIAFDCVVEQGAAEIKTHQERLAFIESLGFNAVWHNVYPVAEYPGETTPLSNTEKVLERHEQEANSRASLPYEIDGLVVRVNDDELFESLGEKDNRPKGAVAFKFQASEATTKLLGVKLSMGHTGAIIPTADLEAVEIGGVTVTSALLNNYEEIERLGIAIGDQVKVIRTGDVIPKIIGVAQAAEDREAIEPPERCWECGFALEKDGAHIFCKNEDCTGKLFRLLKTWVDKRNILHIGDELLQELYNKHNVKEPADLYNLTTDYLAAVPRGAGVVGGNAKRIMTELEKSRECPLKDFMGSLGIKFLGRRQAEIMVKLGIDTLAKFMSLTVADLVMLEGFSETKASAIVQGIQAFKPRIEGLLEFVKVVEPEAKTEVAGGSLDGKVVCFTGVRPSGEEKDRFESLGGEVKSGVSKNLTHLVVKDPTSTSNKAKKARDLGVEIISMEEFRTWLEI